MVAVTLFGTLQSGPIVSCRIALHCIICIVQRLSNDTRQRSASARCAIVEDKGYFRGTLAERTAATTVVAVCASRTIYIKDDLKLIFSVLKMTHEDSLLFLIQTCLF